MLGVLLSDLLLLMHSSFKPPFRSFKGKRTGIVTTSRITHATPAAGYAKAANRNWEGDIHISCDNRPCKDIARQLIEDNPDINVSKILIKSFSINNYRFCSNTSGLGFLCPSLYLYRSSQAQNVRCCITCKNRPLSQKMLEWKIFTMNLIKVYVQLCTINMF